MEIDIFVILKNIQLFFLWVLVKAKNGFKRLWKLKLTYKLLLLGFLIAYFDKFRMYILIGILKIVSLLM